MSTLATALVALIMLLHVYIFVLEALVFETRGRKVFGLKKEEAAVLKAAMSNQGCYNLFLAAALALGLFHPEAAIRHAFTLYGLGCVAVAGLWGGVTVKRSILWIQTAPAILALVATMTQ
ncbi:DUF1304 domain-containing protein [Massilia sp. TS11]|uniref:DUF1304 domain-containing protein n=1 Tax=Massilia sp. TS11 TaxID=2908003 RepID=UPI001EDC86BA|nr:DUF1304 domain-containing protein [Massilia sp. TS11]MCG2584487.1 DUF1304 domain-containing protein [Massilia sp. TS11]